MSDFRKDDGEKPRPELIPSGFITAMGHVMAYGAKKYAVDNWKKCDDVRRYHGAAMRHLLAVIDGEWIDPESGLPHLAHASCSLAMAYGLEEQAEEDAQGCAEEARKFSEEYQKITRGMGWRK